MIKELISPEVFIFEDNCEFIIYSALKGKGVIANEDVLSLINNSETPKELESTNSEIYAKLNEVGFFEKNYPQKEFKIKDKPTQVIVFPTSNCNLRCIYCYGNAGETQINLDFDIAREGIETVIRNALEEKQKKIRLGFHGGGEPFFHEIFDDVVNLVEYAKSRASKENLELAITSSTNGVLPTHKAEWVAQNFNAIILSLDGPEDIQNRQRPGINGNPSFDAAMNFMQILEKNETKYGIRSTITRDSTSEMQRIVEFFSNVSIAQNISLEPVHYVGRSISTETYHVDVTKYTEEFMKARELGRKMGLSIRNSACRIDGSRISFCGAAGIERGYLNFGITPEGYVSSCYEITHLADPRSEDFFYGKYDPEKKTFVFFEDVKEKLYSRTIENIKGCEDCFIKRNCAGDCLARVALTGDYMDTSKNERCEYLRSVAAKLIIELVRNQQ